MALEAFLSGEAGETTGLGCVAVISGGDQHDLQVEAAQPNKTRTSSRLIAVRPDSQRATTGCTVPARSASSR